MSKYLFQLGDQSVTAERKGDGVVIGGDAVVAGLEKLPDGSCVVTVGGQRHRVWVSPDGAWVTVDGQTRAVTRAVAGKTRQIASSGAVKSGVAPGTPPMPGVVARFSVAVGDRVKAGDAIVVLTAMKMEHTLRAPCDGRVRAMLVGVGASVARGQVLVEIEPE